MTKVVQIDGFEIELGRDDEGQVYGRVLKGDTNARHLLALMTILMSGIYSRSWIKGSLGLTYPLYNRIRWQRVVNHVIFSF
jgi:hypothetical protein